MIALLGSAWGAPAIAAASLAALVAGDALGATYDRLTARARARLTPHGSHRR